MFFIVNFPTYFSGTHKHQADKGVQILRENIVKMTSVMSFATVPEEKREGGTAA
jgi:hypothetical protein